MADHGVFGVTRHERVDVVSVVCLELGLDRICGGLHRRTVSATAAVGRAIKEPTRSQDLSAYTGGIVLL